MFHIALKLKEEFMSLKNRGASAEEIDTWRESVRERYPLTYDEVIKTVFTLVSINYQGGESIAQETTTNNIN
jgi:hypothetical protein